MRRPARRLFAICSAVSLVLAAGLSSGGCAMKQGYRVVDAASAEAALAGSASAVEGTLTDATFGPPPVRWYDYLFNWIIPYGGRASDRQHATVAVERVLKGRPPTARLPLRDLRRPSADELNLFPARYGLMNGLRVRVGYDRRRGARYTGLILVPLEVRAEFRHAVREQATQVRRHARVTGNTGSD